MKQNLNTQNKQINKRLGKIVKQLDLLVVILLAQSGLKRPEIAKILGVSVKTVERMIPLRNLTKKGK